MTNNNAVNILKAAHSMAKSWSPECGSYKTRLQLALKQVWEMVREASKCDKSLKVVTGAVKVKFVA